MEITTARYDYKKQSAKKRTHRIFAFFAVLLIIVASSGGYTFAAFNKEIPHLEVALQTLPVRIAENVTLPWSATGQAAIGSMEEGVLAASSNVEVPKPIASMTKVITALTVLQQAPMVPNEPGQSYTLTASDTALYNSYVAKNGSVLPTSAGQSLTQYQALEALLLVSANNIADMLAIRHFGSLDAYVVEANKLVASYGLSKTVIADASGFSPQTVSTPSELVVVAQKALSDPVIAEIVAKPHTSIPGVGLIKNTNRLLNDGRTIGIKTGTTEEAGSCLMFAAKHQIDLSHTVTIIGVIMGDTSASKLFADALALLDSAAQGFAAIEILPAGSKIATVSSKWEQTTDLVTESPLVIYGWKNKFYELESPTLETIHATVSAKETVGTLKLKENDTVVTKIVTTGAISGPPASWRLTNLF